MKRTKRYDLYAKELLDVLWDLKVNNLEFRIKHEEAVNELFARNYEKEPGTSSCIKDLTECVLGIFLASQYCNDRGGYPSCLCDTYEKQLAKTIFDNAKIHTAVVLLTEFGISDGCAPYLPFAYSDLLMDPRLLEAIGDRKRHREWVKLNKEYLREVYHFDVDNKDEFEFRS